MPLFKADLHIHTVLSPCGDVDMTPMFILEKAKNNSYDIIGITDHNSTLQAREMKRISADAGPYVLCGAEITSKEEVHCLAFVDGEKNLETLQGYIRKHLPKIKNNVDVFGYQLLVDENEEVLAEEEYLLISAINQSLEEISDFVYSLGGIFIPAHIDKRQNSIISQLGFLPFDLKYDALELSRHANPEEFFFKNKYIKNKNFIRSSDAHYIKDFGEISILLDMKELSFEEIKKALSGTDGRKIIINNP